MAKIAVVGAGMMGSALTMPLVDAGHEVELVGSPLDDAIVASVRESGLHPKLGLPLDAPVKAWFHGEIGAALAGVDAIALGVSSAGIGWASAAIAPHARADRPIVMITKGLVWNGTTLVTLPEVVRAALPADRRESIFPAAIAGPCIAGELARRVPTCVSLTGTDRATLDRLRDLLRTPYYHLFPSTDVVGVEVCAALKNAYAMGIALAVGQHEQRGGQPGSIAMHNVESAVFAQAVFEMSRVVVALGGDASHAHGLAGVGDLDVTTNGGRTGRFGRWLGLGLSRDEAIAKMDGATLECLEILAQMRAALPTLQARGLLGVRGLPLLEHLAAVALDGAPVTLPLAAFFETPS
jgi:glycerol-3-phosphate dehydrogenase (NAD(P)+)